MKSEIFSIHSYKRFFPRAKLWKSTTALNFPHFLGNYFTHIHVDWRQNNPKSQTDTPIQNVDLQQSCNAKMKSNHKIF